MLQGGASGVETEVTLDQVGQMNSLEGTLVDGDSMRLM